MKTYNIKNYLLTFIVGALLCSCNESHFLTENNPNKPTDGVFWKTPEHLESAMASVYNVIRRSVSGYYGAFDCFQAPNNLCADDIFATLNEEGFTWNYVTYNNTPDTENNPWGYLYTGIQRANVFLYNSEKAPVEDAIKNPMRGEAFFLRGFHYYLLTINFGQAIIHTEPTGLVTNDAQKPLSSQVDVWAQIESDLKAAIDLLPATRPASENGRITRGTAIAFLGKAYLFQKKYEDAKTELEKLMKAPYTYDLMDNFEENFQDDTEFNQESIWELNYDQFGDQSDRWNSGEGADANMGNVLANWFGPQLPASGGWYKMQPSAYLIDEFTAEERPAGSDSRWDKRMYTTLYFKYSDYNDVKEDETWYNGVDFDSMWKACVKREVKDGQPEYSLIDGKEGRFCLKKYTAWWSVNGPTMYGGEVTWSARKTNYRIMRFSEVLLMHAEACAQTGDIAGANADLKRIRERAGLVEKNFASKEALMTEIQHQNLLEFPMESVRLYYLKHWYNDAELKQVFTDRKKQGAEFFQPKHRWLPVPQSELNTNLACEQLEAWQ